MDWLEVMERRHSVRQYTNKRVPQDIQDELADEAKKLNKQSGLRMQLFFDEPDCFSSAMARYGSFRNVNNYLCLVGFKDDRLLDEKAGYYGEMMVMLMQSLGLNSCWVGLNHGKSHATIERDEKQAIVVAFGYGANQGIAHKSKPSEKLCQADAWPEWFKRGMKGAMLAPTAINQQKFLITYVNGRLKAEVNGRGFFTQTDLGIVKRDFELVSGHHFTER